ncbi:YeeE/YedE family protein [Vibrio parahaemolyticus]|nr:YeeE/YedE family protein [Vibrio parahaemolyticus]
MPLILSAFASGLLFGLGLIVSQMVNPAKVLGFLDIFGQWDPSLALVMGGAVAVSALGTLVARRRNVPVLAPRLEIPTRRDLDPRLNGGAALYGVGWGLVGFCPGPALVGLTFGPWQVFVFVAAMIVGMALFRLAPTDWPQVSFRREASQVDG